MANLNNVSLIRANGSNISMMKLNGDVLYEANKPKEFCIEYTVPSDSRSLNSKYSSDYYYYLPKIYSNSSSYKNTYDKVEITLNNGTTTTSLSTACNKISKVKLWYPENTYRISFYNGSSSYPSLITGINYLNVSNFKSMKDMFCECKNLTSINTSSWDTGNVTNMESAFYNCSKLTSLDVSKWNVSNVTDMYSLFRNCSKLTSLDVSKWNVSNVTDMYYLFSACNITSLDLGDWDVSSIKSIDYLLYNCTSLTSLDLSNFNLKNAGGTKTYVFYRCNALEHIKCNNLDGILEMDYYLPSRTSTTPGIVETTYTGTIDTSTLTSKNWTLSVVPE